MTAQRTLGTTGLPLSPLGMGTIQLTRLEMKQSTTLLREVIDLGINWFDTAQGYFDSEIRMGTAFKGIRDNVIIISKTGGGSTSRELEAAINERLRRLQTDYLDMFFFHGLGALEKTHFFSKGGLLATAEKAVRDGKVRFLGFSAHRLDLAIKALDVESFRAAMVPANFITTEFIDGEFLAKAKEKGIGVLAMKPLGGGRVDNARVCLKFLKGYPDVFPCIGIERTREMAEDISIWNEAGSLTEEDEHELKRLRVLLGDKFCRGCRYCMPCPREINIHLVSFLKVLSRQMPRDKVVTRQNTEAARRAGLCTECRECVERCPYNLDIPGMLEENTAYYRKFAGLDREGMNK
ncbi:aldo/keto reductase [Verrucomicrobiota bacterium]